MADATNPPNLWKGQPLHFVCLFGLLTATYWIWSSNEIGNAIAFWAAIASPVVHQIYVWITWRMQLNGGVTARRLWFPGYLTVFFGLFLLRFVTLGLLSWLDSGSLGLAVPWRWILTVSLTLPGAYAGASVLRYFGVIRAAGADHFVPSYRNMPRENRGIFRFTSNGMYAYVFLLFWGIGTALDSSAALIVAGFSHAYIWVHFFATEKPDMEYLYQAEQAPSAEAS